MSRRRPKSKGRQRPRNTIWCREALSAARLVPPAETEGQACWACGRTVSKTMFGYQPKLAEIYDAYGRLCLCEACLKWHLSQLGTDRPGVEREVKPKKKLLTYQEWILEATVDEMQTVLTRMKERLRISKMKK